MKAKKLPSGSWRVQVFSHKDSAGKNHYVSFTAPTKSEALRKGAEFADGKNRVSVGNVTVKEALTQYIKSRENVLSPSTVKAYEQLAKHDYKMIEKTLVAQLRSADLQDFINDAAARVSPKTVRNIYGLLISAIAMYSDMSFRVTLPARKPYEPIVPTDADVKLMLKEADEELRICIMLASMGTLRRGEICGLKYEDILYDFNAVYVHTDIVKDKFGNWVRKEIPKTSGSIRRVILPKDVIRQLGTGHPDEYLIKHPPTWITENFAKLRDRLGIGCRFHDLRHYSASILHAIGVPDVYIMERGGWTSDSTLKQIYRNSLADKSKHFTSLANSYFEEKLSLDFPLEERQA